MTTTNDLSGFAAREAGETSLRSDQYDIFLSVVVDGLDAALRWLHKRGAASQETYRFDIKGAIDFYIGNASGTIFEHGSHCCMIVPRNQGIDFMDDGINVFREAHRVLETDRASAWLAITKPEPERIAAAMEGGEEVWVDAEENQSLFERKAREFQEKHPEFRHRETGAIPTIQRGGYLYHAETGERIGPTLIEVSGTRTTADDIADTCDQIRDMLLEKNRKYGDSALEPVRIFSRATPVEQILVRLDDKLSRLRSAQSDEDEDVVDDLIGYLVLLKIARSR